MSFQQRTVIAVALCALIYLVFQIINPPPPPEELAEDPAAAAESGGAEGPTGQSEGGADPSEDPNRDPKDPKDPALDPADPEAAVPTQSDIEGVDHRLANELIAVDLTNRSPHSGGLIAGLHFLSEQFVGHADEDDALGLAGKPTLEIGFADERSDIRLPRHTNFEVRAASGSTFEIAHTDADTEIVERFDLLEGYEARLSLTVTNRASAPRDHRVHIRTRVKPIDDRYDVRRGVCRTAEDVEDEDHGDVEDGPIKHGPSILWGGVDTKYFATLVVPEEPLVACEVRSDEDLIVTTLSSAPTTLQPGEARTYTFGVYLGVKELERLQAFSAVSAAGVHLEEDIDWGFFGAVSESVGRFLLVLLRWFYGLTASWGFSIVLLTVLVKLITLPLTLKQMSSMKRMKEIQPEIAKIKEKYGDDKVKQGQEMQALFSRSGVNPLAGCLPMIVQLPIWFALYSMLLTAVELVHEPFLWLPDLTKQDPLYVLPIALGAMMVLQNRLMPNTMDAAQAKMMRWMMPAMFTLFMLVLPSGLGVYIFANIVLSVIQTAVQVGSNKKPAPATT